MTDQRETSDRENQVDSRLAVNKTFHYNRCSVVQNTNKTDSDQKK